MQIHRVSRQIDVNHIGRTYDHRPTKLISLMLYVNCIMADGDIVFLGLFEHAVLNCAFALRSIAVTSGFILDSVLKLIVLEVRRNNLCAYLHPAHEDKDSEKHLDAAHVSLTLRYFCP